ncbi:hypothetical protein M878_44990 [Streptomyces roseochromogenus subsp. oscitans DS 12.976]|uniref:3-ketosteroid-9-alpha-monooxygenase oxygenase component-like C-terminal domain-containing protein n=1 Tax=Streptomyces roseochromogenus subsp. oscitans DS 12.976 TaxID=1352936 RepID=V6JFJ2_STRRC|nr:hypothetical protein M878_44990 [Streptomyces roseochromogenus subsp. oscitans DS 12.976]
MPELRIAGFPRPIEHTRTLTAYPQDVNENAFDVGHFPTLHGYQEARVDAVEFDGPRSRSCLVTRRRFPLAGALRFVIYAQGYGVGLTRALADIPQIRSQADSYIFSTPTGPRAMEFRVSASLKCPISMRQASGGRATAALAFSWLLTHLLGPTVRHDLVNDYPIWNHKVYLPQPRLAEGDGPISRYRQWAQQFYA